MSCVSGTACLCCWMLRLLLLLALTVILRPTSLDVAGMMYLHSFTHVPWRRILSNQVKLGFRSLVVRV